MIEERIESTQTEKEPAKSSASEQRGMMIGAIIFAIITIGLFVWGLISLIQAAPDQTAKVRDIFIIFMALESLVIGAALVILIIQIASLMNLLQNEIKPIMDATNETVHTLRGTTAFLSENMIEPVVKLNANLAGLQRVLELLGIKRK